MKIEYLDNYKLDLKNVEEEKARKYRLTVKDVLAHEGERIPESLDMAKAHLLLGWDESESSQDPLEFCKALKETHDADVSSSDLSGATRTR